MDSLGSIWIHLDSLGLTWTHLDSVGLTWTHLDSLGFTWTNLDSLGFTWTHSDSLGFTWTHSDSLGLTWTHSDSLGLTWTHLDSLGLTWTHLVSLGLTTTLLDSLGLTTTHHPPEPKGKRERGRASIFSNSDLTTRPRVRTHERNETISRLGSLPPTSDLHSGQNIGLMHPQSGLLCGAALPGVCFLFSENKKQHLRETNIMFLICFTRCLIKMNLFPD